MSFHAPYCMEGTPTEPCDDPTCAYNRHEGPHSYDDPNFMRPETASRRCFRCDGLGCAECWPDVQFPAWPAYLCRVCKGSGERLGGGRSGGGTPKPFTVTRCDRCNGSGATRHPWRWPSLSDGAA